MCKIKLIALDLDGTLLHSDKTLSPRNHAALERAKQAGIHIILASGRKHLSMTRYAVELGLTPDTPVISYNGAMVRTVGGDTLFEIPLDSDVAVEVVDFCRDNGLHLNYYLHGVLYAAERDRWVDIYYDRTGSETTVVGDLRRFAGERPTKVLIMAEPATIDRLAPVMQARFDGRANVVSTDFDYLEFMSPDASKGLALAKVAEHLGVRREECLAMGDNNNDLSMILWAGRGIAMEGGRESLLAQIPEHAPPADEDGVACVVEKLLA